MSLLRVCNPYAINVALNSQGCLFLLLREESEAQIKVCRINL